MNIQEGILDVLIDSGESIVQIEHYLVRYDISDDRQLIIKEIQKMLLDNDIYIAYPQQSSDQLNVEEIEEYWFELTDAGKGKWKEFKVRWERENRS